MPRPSPCPRDESAVRRSGRTCLRKCNGDRDCLSKRKVCLCDGMCGLSCVNPDKECPDLDNPLFGFVEFNGKRVGAQARYKCQQGYHLIGDETRQCQGDGTWSSAPPECRENLYCTTPPVIAHARHDGVEARTRFEVNHTLKYRCYEGYTTTGFDVAKCFLYNNTMQWFGPEIECVPKECGDPGEILNGFKEGSCYSFSCRVTYHCRPGFSMEGRSKYYCQHDGTWNPRDLPTCKPIQCSMPDNPENGQAKFNSVFYNAVVSYDCNYGYMIVGPSTRRCGPDTRWSGSMPRCKEIDCGFPGDLYNGWLEGSRTNFGAVYKFRCNDNMKYEGYHDHRTECQKNGTWSHPLPKCLAPCIVPTIENGNLTNGTKPGSQVPHGSVIRVRCSKSYEPTFKTVPSTCYNGTWTHYPHCQPARCKKLPVRPRHGMVIAPRTGHGMRAKYRCKDGYELMGPQTTKCHFGNWTGRTPWCRVVYCPFPGYLVDGRVLLVGNMGMYIYRPYVRKVRNDRRIRYECNRGYFLSEGPPGATCVAGKWSPKNLPKCSPELHPRVQWMIKRSVNMSDYLEYLNATQEGETTKELTDRAFDGRDGGVAGLSTLAGSLVGSLASWLTGQNPEADHIEGPITIANNTNESVSDSLIIPVQHNNNTKEETTVFSPLKDTEKSTRLETWAKYEEEGREWARENSLFGRRSLSGSGSQVDGGSALLARVLRNTKRETKSDDHKRRNKSKKKGKKAPHCEELGGEPYLRVEVVRAGRDTNYTFSAGARVRVTCLYGHGLNIGNKTAKCSRGRWKPMKPECISLPCSVPEALNGQYTFNGGEVPERATIGHAEVVKFSCHSGYTVLGSDTLRCWYGEWTVTGTSPQCQPEPCTLPKVIHGQYAGDEEEGSKVVHGSKVEYSCEEGWLVNVEEVRCELGHLQPSPPTCVTPAQATHAASHNLPPPLKRTPTVLSYGKGDLTPGGDITGIDLIPNLHNSCSPPARVRGTIIYKNGQPLHRNERRFPDGTVVTFNCITNTIGEKTTWKIRCEEGSWVGQKAPSPCGLEEEQEDDDDNTEDLSVGNNSCTWRNNHPNLVTFHNDKQVKDDVAEFPPGTELVSRCVDIGKYGMAGSSHRRCLNGYWTSGSPVCFGLNREYDYALDRPPTILFRHKNGPIAQTNDGRLLVYPGTELYLECLWMRRYGTPRWNVSHSHAPVVEETAQSKVTKKPTEVLGKVGGSGPAVVGVGKYWTGWTTDALRNPQLEFRLALYTTHHGDSGDYTCVTPTGHSHTVTLDIRRVDCPPLNISTGQPGPGPAPPNHHPEGDTALGTVVTFSCGRGTALIGERQAKCLPSGNWSGPVPSCEKVRCSSPGAPEHGEVTRTGPFAAGDVVEIKCHSSFMLVGQPLLVCQDDGTWSSEVPKCSQACTYPGIIISGTMSSVKFYYPIEDSITYNCSSQFVLHGEKTITCLEGGRWSAPVPSCLPRP
ncbi:complement factor H-like isoform X2 [Homarus americanus]|uniref:complement factor H-like isoform X2 n=1 Tax=Homarus americanus TaxID=6706 RepID=UPI001C440E88|nr:complement factor H-like isoform X2 [Homarus americanus]